MFLPLKQKKNPKRKMHNDMDDDMDVKPTMKYKGATQQSEFDL